ncbi:O-antigen ligase family protein [Pricia sp. S334]|uniref:O-antigen ligase family protein n=1 Tax=Pricia mediterranea TaxID=3076079 RepID=A0ABU3L443_9FLAO|nr:O-antigen ligase family protein [Pricia sp. S334]MDT7828091.1 O-antigen ligase family protein [Pricia sp. S334]
MEQYLLFILYFLPLMALKVVKEDWGGFKIFDVITFFSLVFLFRRFVTISNLKRFNFYFTLFLALISIIFVGMLVSDYPENALLKLIKILPIFIFGRFLITECLINSTFHLKVINAIKFSFIVSLIFLSIQIVVGLNFTWYPNLNPNIAFSAEDFIRYPGIFHDPQLHGQYLAMGSIIFLTSLKEMKRKAIIIQYFVFVSGIFALTLTASRAALAGLFVGLFVIFILVGRRYLAYIIALFIFGYFSYNIILENSPVLQRTEDLDSDFEYRQSIWIDAFEIAKAHPFLGIGWGNYQNYIMRHKPDQYHIIEDEILYFDQPENGYLKVLVEVGFVGFALFLTFIILPLSRGFYFFVRNPSENRLAFLIGSLVCWVVAFTSVYSLFDDRILIVVVTIICLLISYSEKQNRKNEDI